MKRLIALYRGHWRGEFPPVTSVLGTGLVLGAVTAVIVRLLFMLAYYPMSDLRLLVMIELIEVVFMAAIVTWVVVGILRSIWRATGSPNPALAIATPLAAAIVAILVVMEYEPNRERVLLALGEDEVGAPAKVALEAGTLRLEGAIANGAADRFLALAAKIQDGATVILESEGGRVMEARRIALEVRRRGFKVYVPQRCESACTDILVASPDRVIDVNAEIGFHRGTFAGNSEAEDLQIADAGRDWLLDHGVAAAFVDRVVATPASDMWYPGADELVEAAVIDRVAVEQANVDDAEWIEAEKPWAIGGDWLVVGATAKGARLVMDYGFIPGTDMAHARPSPDRARASIEAILCESDFYAPMMEHGSIIAMNPVDGGDMIEVRHADC